ncbi:hypothetical protein DPMN_135902 [Dreissena polymorpha]|uniref:Sodium-coupled monocarboxylate transporter 1 n=1 Tax=Dreissena polymorpha TaxID=45954 RepID=A0A9D4G4S8_DREPO|nr:hypothetical protein DPMN_135902 [Dreissena polymorpha]
MVNPDHLFHWADYLIFFITIAVSLGIGIYYALSGGKQRTTSEYFVGNRRMAILPVAISLMVTFESSIMMLGTPAEVHVFQLLSSRNGKPKQSRNRLICFDIRAVNRLTDCRIDT